MTADRSACCVREMSYSSRWAAGYVGFFLIPKGLGRCPNRGGVTEPAATHPTASYTPASCFPTALPIAC